MTAPPTTTAMILAAGKGTRMRPLTLQTPKPLLSVGGHPLIDWHIYALKQAGISRIVINVAWLADKLIAYLGNGERYGVEIVISRETDPLETAGGIRQASQWLGDEPFILVNGDVWSTYDFSDLVQMSLEPSIIAHLLLVNNPPHNPSGDFGLAGGMVVDYLPPDTLEGKKHTFSGVSKLSLELVSTVSEGQAAALAPLLFAQIANQAISGAMMSTSWYDIGTPERLTQLNQRIDQAPPTDHPAWQHLNPLP